MVSRPRVQTGMIYDCVNRGCAMPRVISPREAYGRNLLLLIVNLGQTSCATCITLQDSKIGTVRYALATPLTYDPILLLPMMDRTNGQGSSQLQARKQSVLAACSGHGPTRGRKTSTMAPIGTTVKMARVLSQVRRRKSITAPFYLCLFEQSL